MQPEKSTGTLDRAWEINFNDIKFEKELGQGAFGIVYLAKWRLQEVAVKKIKTDLNEKQKGDFIKEAELMKSLRPHKNVVTLLGVCYNPACIVTDYLPNGTVYHYLRNRDVQIDGAMVLKMARDVCAGMSHLHAEGIVHRDLAARNLLLTKTLEVKVSDFGMSRVLLVGQANSAVTQTDVGPLKWMAPESILEKTYSTKSDVYSFGIVMVELLTRDDPFPTMDTVHVAIGVTRDNMVHPIPENTPPKVANLLKSCWERDPAKRPEFERLHYVLEELQQDADNEDYYQN